jgi:hypothetical protein
LERYVVSCQTVEIDKPLIDPHTEIELDENAGTCSLTIFGEPGARFVLEER